MTERESRSTYIGLIDHMMRELAWHAQKQSMHMLTHPELDLTLPQMITLFAIQESKTCRMSTLAEMTQQSAGTLTGIVDRLIDDGLVERTRNTDDRRVVQVMLTDEGQRRLSHVVEARHDDTRRLLGQFNDEELMQVGVIFRRLLDTLQHRTPANAHAQVHTNGVKTS